MTADDLRAIEERANAATAGKWEWQRNDRGRDFLFCTLAHADSVLCATTADYEMSDADMSFIAHAREDIPRLIAEVRSLQQQVSCPHKSVTFETYTTDPQHSEYTCDTCGAHWSEP